MFGKWIVTLLLVASADLLGTLGTATPNSSGARPTSTTNNDVHLLKRQSIEYAYKRESVCGYVTGDVHWPWYCPVGSKCLTKNQYIQCCQTATTSSWIDVGTALYTTTIRNTYTDVRTTTTSFANNTVIGINCTSYTACYDSTAAEQCTGSCTEAAVLCNEPAFPYCASVYYENGLKTSGMGYMCDTAAYGMQLSGLGYWPTSSVTGLNTSRTTSSRSTIGPATTFPIIVLPFSRTQASRPQQALDLTSATATITTSAAARTAPGVQSALLTVLLVMQSQWLFA